MIYSEPMHASQLILPAQRTQIGSSTRAEWHAGTRLALGSIPKVPISINRHASRGIKLYTFNCGMRSE